MTFLLWGQETVRLNGKRTSRYAMPDEGWIQFSDSLGPGSSFLSLTDTHRSRLRVPPGVSTADDGKRYAYLLTYQRSNHQCRHHAIRDSSSARDQIITHRSSQPYTTSYTPLEQRTLCSSSASASVLSAEVHPIGEIGAFSALRGFRVWVVCPASGGGGGSGIAGQRGWSRPDIFVRTP